ncbi:dynamin family protein [Microtetraspora fusca]|uniref:Dynamin family protein n=1 Tax=Microtetraspora fusca TaxID=1997 RepID=A0ABW6VE48_MICFU
MKSPAWKTPDDGSVDRSGHAENEEQAIDHTGEHPETPGEQTVAFRPIRDGDPADGDHPAQSGPERPDRSDWDTADSWDGFTVRPSRATDSGTEDDRWDAFTARDARASDTTGAPDTAGAPDRPARPRIGDRTAWATPGWDAFATQQPRRPSPLSGASGAPGAGEPPRAARPDIDEPLVRGRSARRDPAWDTPEHDVTPGPAEEMSGWDPPARDDAARRTPAEETSLWERPTRDAAGESASEATSVWDTPAKDSAAERTSVWDAPARAPRDAATPPRDGRAVSAPRTGSEGTGDWDAFAPRSAAAAAREGAEAPETTRRPDLADVVSAGFAAVSDGAPGWDAFSTATRRPTTGDLDHDATPGTSGTTADEDRTSGASATLGDRGTAPVHDETADRADRSDPADGRENGPETPTASAPSLWRHAETTDGAVAAREKDGDEWSRDVTPVEEAEDETATDHSATDHSTTPSTTDSSAIAPDRPATASDGEAAAGGTALTGPAEPYAAGVPDVLDVGDGENAHDVADDGGHVGEIAGTFEGAPAIDGAQGDEYPGQIEDAPGTVAGGEAEDAGRSEAPETIEWPGGAVQTEDGSTSEAQPDDSGDAEFAAYGQVDESESVSASEAWRSDEAGDEAGGGEAAGQAEAWRSDEIGDDEVGGDEPAGWADAGPIGPADDAQWSAAETDAEKREAGADNETGDANDANDVTGESGDAYDITRESGDAADSEEAEAGPHAAEGMPHDDEVRTDEAANAEDATGTTGGPDDGADEVEKADTAQAAVEAEEAEEAEEDPAARVRKVPLPEPVSAALTDALDQLRLAVEDLHFGLDIPGAEEARKAQAAVLAQLEDYVIPRVHMSTAPALIVVAGSTGAGKSTLVNTLAAQRVSTTGVRRPTTGTPVLVCHPDDHEWFAEGDLLGGLTRLERPVEGVGTDSVVLSTTERLPPGVALLDTPDIDSVVEEHHEIAHRMLDAADMWVFVTTASRYADAPSWNLLRLAKERGARLVIVLSRVPEKSRDVIVKHFGRMLDEYGLADAERFVIKETTVTEGRLPDKEVSELRMWLAHLSVDDERRAAAVRTTLNGVLDSFRNRVPALARHLETQVVLRADLRSDVDAAYMGALADIDEATRNGSLLRGEVLARWQDFAGSGDLIRTLQLRRGGKGGQRGPQRARALRTAIRNALESVINSAAERAAEEVVVRWRQRAGAGDRLAATPGLGRSSDEATQRTSRAIGAWQDHVTELIRTEGVTKRSVARLVSFDVESLALIFTVSLLGYGATDVSSGRGAGALPQRLLRALLGAESLRNISAKARSDLRARIGMVFDEETLRYVDELDGAGIPDEAAATRLYQATYNLEVAR